MVGWLGNYCGLLWHGIQWDVGLHHFNHGPCHIKPRPGYLYFITLDVTPSHHCILLEQTPILWSLDCPLVNHNETINICFATNGIWLSWRRLYWIIDNAVLIQLIYLSLLEMFHFIQSLRRHNKLLYLDSMNLQFKGVDSDDIAVVGLKDITSWQCFQWGLIKPNLSLAARLGSEDNVENNVDG